MESSQKTGGGQSRVGDQGDVFGQVEHGKGRAVVFRVIAAGEFLLRFGDIEGGAVHFGGTGNEEQNEGDKAQHGNLENPPVENRSLLAHGNVHQVGRT